MSTPNIPGLPTGATVGAPVQQATTVANQPQSATAGLPPGATVGAPVHADTLVSDQPSQTQQSASAPVATISPIALPKTPMGKLAAWIDNVSDDLKYGTDRTGVGTVLKALGAHGLYNGNSAAVGDFMGSLPLGLLKAVKGDAELTPQIVGGEKGRTWQGVKDLVGGGLQATQMPGIFVAPEAAEATPEIAGAALSKAGDVAGDLASKTGDVASKAGEVAGRTVQVVKRPFSLKAVADSLQNAKEGVQQELQTNLQGIQNEWHGAVRDLFDSVAKEAGVEPKPAESLHDVAANTAAALKAKASDLYKQLDAAVGGTRFQTFDEQLSNVKRALRNSAGIDPDADGRLVERINALEDAKANALEQAKAAGVDPNLIHEANATHRQAMALEDLSKHIRSSMEGLRTDVAQGAKAAPESLSPAKLAPKANRLYNTGRLQQAIGEDRADDLLRAIESTKQAAKDAAQNAVQKTEAATAKAGQQASNVKLARYAATSALAGIPGLGLLWHLLGE